MRARGNRPSSGATAALSCELDNPSACLPACGASHRFLLRRVPLTQPASPSPPPSIWVSLQTHSRLIGGRALGLFHWLSGGDFSGPSAPGRPMGGLPEGSSRTASHGLQRIASGRRAPWSHPKTFFAVASCPPTPRGGPAALPMGPLPQLTSSSQSGILSAPAGRLVAEGEKKLPPLPGRGAAAGLARPVSGMPSAWTGGAPTLSDRV